MPDSRDDPELHRFEAAVDGDLFPFVLSRDESRVMYGRPVEGSFTGSLRMLGEGASPPVEIDPGALVDLPHTFDALRDESLVLPGPGGTDFLFRLAQDPFPDDWGAPWLSTVMAYQAGIESAFLVAPLAVHGPWTTIPGSKDVLYFDGFGNLTRGTPGARRRVLVSGVVVHGRETFEMLASLSPGGSALAVRGSSGVYLVDLSANTTTLVVPDSGPGPVPAFSNDGTRLAVKLPTNLGTRLTLMELPSGAVVESVEGSAVVPSPDLKRALVSLGPRPGGVELHVFGGGADVLLGEKSTSAGFTADGKWIWNVEGGALRLRKVDGASIESLSSPCANPEPLVPGGDDWVFFERCLDDGSRLVAHRIGGSEEQDLGMGTRVLSVAPDGRAVLLADYLPTSSWQLFTWDTATGQKRDRGTYGYVDVAPDGSKVLGAGPGLHALDAFGTLDVQLDAAQPRRWLIGNHRAAWTDGTRVVLSDLP